MDILISNLFLKSIFNFGKWTNVYEYTYSHIHVFSVWPLPEVKNWILKQIWHENVHISIQNFFLKRIGQYLKKSKNGFPIVFSKCDLAEGGHFFITIFFPEKAKHPQICQKFGGNVGET